LGSFVFGLISDKVINPNGENKEELDVDTDLDQKISIFFYVLAASFFATFVLAIIFITFPQKEEKEVSSSDQNGISSDRSIKTNNEKRQIKENEKISIRESLLNENKKECQTVKQALKSIVFYQLFATPLFQGCKKKNFKLFKNNELFLVFPQYLSSQYKPFASQIDQSTLSLIGSFSMASNALGRISLGELIDKFGFKKIYLIVTVLQVFLSEINNLIFPRLSSRAQLHSLLIMSVYMQFIFV